MTTTMTRVRDVMNNDFVEVDGLLTVEEALRIMKTNQAHSLIIRKRHEDDEYGIVVLADIAKKVLAKNRAASRVNIYEIMSKPVISVRANMDIKNCARLFDRFGLAGAPVFEHGRIVGIVTYEEIVLNGLANQVLNDE